jgi:hypothetical protein
VTLFAASEWLIAAETGRRRSPSSMRGSRPSPRSRSRERPDGARGMRGRLPAC